MDNDFYMEDNHSWKIIIGTFIFIVLVVAGIWYYQHYSNTNIKLKEVTVELGSLLPTDINTYISGKNMSDYELDTSSVHLNEEKKTDSVGEYKYRIIKNDIIKTGKIYVSDTVAPEITVNDLIVGINEKFSASEFLETCHDLSNECSVKFQDDITNIVAEVGTYNIIINVSDNFNNITSKEVKLTVSSTTTLEEIKSNDFTVVETSPEDLEWNNTYTYKFTNCVPDKSTEYELKLTEISSDDYGSFSKKNIKDQQLLVAYNKYHYVIGISVKIIYEDNTINYIIK